MQNTSPFVAIPVAGGAVETPPGRRFFIPMSDVPQPDGPSGYLRLHLLRTAQLGIDVARWVPGGDAPLHGHGESAALYSVMQGRVREERFLPCPDGTFRFEVATLEAGQQSCLPAGAFHRVIALESAFTMHWYSPAPNSTTTVIDPATQRLLDRARVAASRPAVLPAPTRRDIVEVVGGLVDGWAGREAQANQDGELRLPAETLAEFRADGLLSAPIPIEQGGWGMSLRQVAEALRLIGRRAPSTALALVMPLANAATTRIPPDAVPPGCRSDLDAGKRWIVEKVLAGKVLAVANSEPGAGGELKNTRTVALRGDDGVFRLTGRKSFATFGRDADYFLCAARRRARTGHGPDVIDGFFVARDADGLALDEAWDPAGMRPTASVGLSLRDAEAEAVLGYPGCLEGVSARHWSTILFAAVFLGVGEGALNQGLAQVPSGAVWARGTLAERRLELDAAAGFLEAVASDERWPLPAEAQERTRRAKTFVAKTAVQTAAEVAMISGGRCYTPQHPVFRFLCDALAGPLLRPPMPQAMDAIVDRLFPPASPAKAVA